MTFKEETAHLLSIRPRNLTYKDIEKRTGIKETWLNKFASGKIKGPNVDTIEKLNNFLKGFNENV